MMMSMNKTELGISFIFISITFCFSLESTIVGTEFKVL